MDDMAVWISPLLLLPGAALIIVSTSARSAELHAELHHLHERHDEDCSALADKLHGRARYFRNALVGLYTCTALLSLAGLIGGVSSLWTESFHVPVAVLTGLGILCLLYAAVQLIRESGLSLDAVEQHVGDIRRRRAGQG